MGRIATRERPAFPRESRGVMPDVIYLIEYRLRGFRPDSWMRANTFHPQTRLQADRLVEACERCMPAREHRVVEIATVNELDIPF